MNEEERVIPEEELEKVEDVVTNAAIEEPTNEELPVAPITHGEEEKIEVE